MSEKVGAICVVYNPDIKGLIQNIDKYAIFFEQLVVIDNSEQVNSELSEGLHKLDNVQYVALNANRGIGYAQNIGIKRLSTNITQVAFFDQDSWTTPSDLNVLSTILQSKKDYALVNLSTDKFRTDEPKLVDVTETISSGSLVRRSVFEQVGYFDEDLFIDFIDYEFCWRVLRNGYKVGVVQGIQLHHQVDSKNNHNHTVSAPFRNYYVFRNGLLLMKQRRVYNWLYVSELLFKRLGYELLFNHNRVIRLKYIFKGIVDAVKGKEGQLIERH